MGLAPTGDGKIDRIRREAAETMTDVESFQERYLALLTWRAFLQRQGAYSDEGYSPRASYGLFLQAIEHFGREGLDWINLGAGAGLATTAQDGLSRFKSGWATGTRPAFFCGRILNRTRYEELVDASGHLEGAYFPAYRVGEFA